MANRNFNKKLALALGALIGGTGALSSMNVSTSAMEHKNYKETERVRNLVRYFKEKYNERQNQNLTDDQQYYKFHLLFDDFLGWTRDKSSAYHLASSIAYSHSKDLLKNDLERDYKELQELQDYTAADTVGMLIHYLFRDNGINWAA